MLLQTNSYVVPKEKRNEHNRLLRKFRQTLARLGCDQFEVYEQVGNNWGAGESTGRFVQLMKFRDRKHQQEVQAAERQDKIAQQLVSEFCELINFPYQQQQGLFAIGYYTGTVVQGPAGRNGSEEPGTEPAIDNPGPQEAFRPVNLPPDASQPVESKDTFNTNTPSEPPVQP